MPGSIRAFVALALPDEHREQLAGHLEACARLAPGYRWVPADALHLTLRFLGHLEPEALERVRRELGGVRAAPFRLALGGRAALGARSAPRVVWLGVREGLEACAALAGSVETACRDAGMEADARGFRAHVSLARQRREGERLGRLPEPPELAPWVVDDFVLYESRLRQEPRYVPLDRYPLGGG